MVGVARNTLLTYRAPTDPGYGERSGDMTDRGKQQTMPASPTADNRQRMADRGGSGGQPRSRRGPGGAAR